MAKLKMKKVRIIALRKDRKRLLEHLQDSALVQINSAEDSREGFSRVDMSSQTQVFERNVTLTEQALKILGDLAPEKAGMLSSFKGRREIDPDEIGEIAKNSKDVIAVCNRIVELDKQCSDNDLGTDQNQARLSNLEVWQKLDIPLNTTSTRSTAVFIGTFPEEYSEKTLRAAIAKENPKLEFELEVEHSEYQLTCAVIFVPISQQKAAEDVLRTLGYSKPMSPTSKVPKVKAEKLREKQNALKRNRPSQGRNHLLADKRESIKVDAGLFQFPRRQVQGDQPARPHKARLCY